MTEKQVTKKKEMCLSTIYLYKYTHWTKIIKCLLKKKKKEKFNIKIIFNMQTCHQHPNFEEVGGAYCFRVVCLSVHHARLHDPIVSGTLNSIPLRCWSCFLMHARVLKSHVWIPHEKIADQYFFSCPIYVPFWSYAPLKKSEWNLVTKVSLNYLS